MIVAITGSTSFLGKSLIERFLALGHEVIAIGRSSYCIYDKTVMYVKAEMSEYKNLHEHIKEADIFINLAWEGTGHGGRNAKEIQIHNINNSIEALKSSKRMGCRVFIQAGSQAEYGLAISKTSESDSCHPFTEYGRAKLEMQNKAFRLSTELGISYIHLRIFSLIGENDHPWTLLSSSIEKMISNEDIELTQCTQLWNFLYVDDASIMISRIAEHYFNSQSVMREIFNIASDDTRILKEYVEETLSITNSYSKCLYGVKKQEHVVSLNPDITKYKLTIGSIDFTPFHVVVSKILEKYD